MSFDPMAAAVDWLEAYRVGDIDAIVEMHADDAVVHCGCGCIRIITEKEALRAYFVKLLQEYPVSDLNDLQPLGEGTMISYIARGRVVTAILTFNASGQIASLSCGPSN
jgi:hypothetical protein